MKESIFYPIQEHRRQYEETRFKQIMNLKPIFRLCFEHAYLADVTEMTLLNFLDCIKQELGPI